MLSVNFGPFPVPVSQLLLLAALLAALAAGHLAGRRQRTGGIGPSLSDMLLAGLLASRIAFVVLWFDAYRQAPWSMLDIRDGGFTPRAGLAAALLVALWQGWRRASLRRPLMWGLAAGAVVWGGLWGSLRMMEEEKPALPTLQLATLAGASVDLARLAAGRPMVVNLWASWCPPCRREMPVLAAAQQRETGVVFVFANQGEGAAAVLRYVAASQLALAHVLLDPDAALGKAVGSASLPTTLFYDARGRLVDTHLGELSAASLTSQLQQLRTP